LEVKVVEVPVQTEVFPLITPAEGEDVIVKVCVAVLAGQPFTPACVYVIVTVPALMFVIKPVEELIVAILGSPLDHVPPATVDVNVFVPDKQIVCAPLNTPTLAAPLIFIDVDAVALIQPPVPNTVYITVALPTLTPESKPEVGWIVAIADEEPEIDQFPPGELDVNCDVFPSHKVVVPLIVPAIGFAVMVTVRVDTASAQPCTPTTV